MKLEDLQYELEQCKVTVEVLNSLISRENIRINDILLLLEIRRMEDVETMDDTEAWIG